MRLLVQGFQPLLEAAVVANRSVDIPAMEANYIALLDSSQSVYQAGYAAPESVSAAGGPATLSPALPSLADFRTLLTHLTEQQDSIAQLKIKARPQDRQLINVVSVYLANTSNVAALHGIALAQDDVGTLRVGAARLQAALLPTPQRLMAQLHERLPALAAIRYTQLSNAIHTATSRLLQRPASIDDAVERLSFLTDLQVPRALVTAVAI